jgi:hypothetical protein
MIRETIYTGILNEPFSSNKKVMDHKNLPPVIHHFFYFIIYT